MLKIFKSDKIPLLSADDERRGENGDRTGADADACAEKKGDKGKLMANLIDKVFGTHSERELKRIAPIVDKIESLRPEMQALSDEELRGKTQEFKKRLAAQCCSGM